jgi:hypothetical protein
VVDDEEEEDVKDELFRDNADLISKNKPPDIA